MLNSWLHTFWMFWTNTETFFNKWGEIIWTIEFVAFLITSILIGERSKPENLAENEMNILCANFLDKSAYWVRKIPLGKIIGGGGGTCPLCPPVPAPMLQNHVFPLIKIMDMNYASFLFIKQFANLKIYTKNVFLPHLEKSPRQTAMNPLIRKTLPYKPNIVTWLCILW